MNLNPLSWFRKKQKEELPQNFAIVRYTKQAKDRGLFNEENSRVFIFKGGRVAEPPQPYTEELIKSLREIDEIPVEYEEFSQDEDYNFQDLPEFGSVEFRR